MKFSQKISSSQLSKITPQNKQVTYAAPQNTKLSIELSLYLDLVRFLSALTVFFAHASHRYFTGGFLWQAAGYGQTAVMIFFVLSGYVIGYVVHTRENNILNYARQD